MSATVLESLQRRLEADLSEVCGHLNVLHERMVSITREALETAGWEGQGLNTPAAWLAWQTGLSPERAKQIVMIASRQVELPVTFAAFANGLLSVDQVAVVAKRAPVHNDREACDLAQAATVAQLRVAMSKHFLPAPAAEVEDPTPTAEPVHHLSVGFNDGGDFYLHGLADTLDGAIINNALTEAKDALFDAGNTDVTWLDALLEVCQRSLGTIVAPSRQDLYRTIVHLDTEGAWIHNGPAIPPELMSQITCCGMIQPLWSTKGIPISIGRARHIAPLRTRRVIEDRDRLCRHPSCHSTLGLEVHHIHHWEAGGATDTHNLCLLCKNHHKRHHKREFFIAGNANDPNGLTFYDAAGNQISACGKPEPPGNAPPPAPPKRYMHPTGERMYLKWLDFRPPPNAPSDAS
jgi:hypothetical protein